MTKQWRFPQEILAIAETPPALNQCSMHIGMSIALPMHTTAAKANVLANLCSTLDATIETEALFMSMYSKYRTHHN